MPPPPPPHAQDVHVEVNGEAVVEVKEAAVNDVATTATVAQECASKMVDEVSAIIINN